MMDLRLPIGVFFLLVGAILTVYGAIAPHDIPHISEKINIDLDWGILQLAFGIGMTYFGWKAEAKARAEKKTAKS